MPRTRRTAWRRYFQWYGSACLALSLAIFAGCSSEPLVPPPPELYQSGAFLAVGDQELSLYRTLSALRIEGDRIVFATLYDVTPADFDEAREIAKHRDIRIRQMLVTLSEALVREHRFQVVWFRTLTKEEEDRAP